jgi:hypothetical protein
LDSNNFERRRRRLLSYCRQTHIKHNFVEIRYVVETPKTSDAKVDQNDVPQLVVGMNE